MEECENKMIGEIYLSKIFIEWDELLWENLTLIHHAIKIVLVYI